MLEATRIAVETPPRYRKIGGGLLLFVVLIACGTVLSVIMDIQAMLAGRDLPAVTINLLQSVGWWVALGLLLRLDRRGLWLARALLAVGILLGLFWAGSGLVNAKETQDVIGMFGVAVIDALWLLYLSRSRRVNRDTAWQRGLSAATATRV